jgi:hypothetical protein
MTRLRADVQTSHASRYLQQLCKHWSHRFGVVFDPAHGVVSMPGADCIFDADPHSLSMTLEGDDAQALSRLSGVVTEHLKRFAFREKLDVQWVETASEHGTGRPAEKA